MDALDETPQAMDDSQVWKTLCAAHTAYLAAVSPAYDEVLDEVADRIQAVGSIGKADIGALLFWKRLRANTPWVPQLMRKTDQEVREVTENAVTAVNDRSLSVHDAACAGRDWLKPLPGFRTGDAFASSLLLAAAPKRMAVYDRRARAALKILDCPLSAAPKGRYGRYMALVEGLRLLAERNDHSWSARDVDIALYWLGGPNTGPG